MENIHISSLTCRCKGKRCHRAKECFRASMKREEGCSYIKEMVGECQFFWKEGVSAYEMVNGEKEKKSKREKKLLLLGPCKCV